MTDTLQVTLPPGLAKRCEGSLVLLLDSSSSVGDENWKNQVHSTANAITDPTIIQIIKESGPFAFMARSFDGPAPQGTSYGPHGQGDEVLRAAGPVSREMTPWRILATEEDAYRYAAELKSAGVGYPKGGDTRIGKAVKETLPLFADSPCYAGRKMIDLSSDGQSDTGQMDQARAEANAAKVRVNAITIGNEDARVKLEQHIVAYGGFAMQADWENYQRTFVKKLTLELAMR